MPLPSLPLSPLRQWVRRRLLHRLQPRWRYAEHGHGTLQQREKADGFSSGGSGVTVLTGGAAAFVPGRPAHQVVGPRGDDGLFRLRPGAQPLEAIPPCA
ncbi:hypothetical protein AU476_33500 [Cupriavidus sp. UYMSc13B]|nr:hypothetical protein AU476_33500 [Cupriavidus sp. UYMSc13B]